MKLAAIDLLVILILIYEHNLYLELLLCR